jgi:drug/metabolite transporter (DMT)-like permease
VRSSIFLDGLGYGGLAFGTPPLLSVHATGSPSAPFSHPSSVLWQPSRAYFVFRERLTRIQVAGVVAIAVGVAAVSALQA